MMPLIGEGGLFVENVEQVFDINAKRGK
jgi:hypothetical protein